MNLWKRKARRTPGPGVRVAGHFLSIDELCMSILISGGIGKGKSWASELIILQLATMGCYILACCVKSDEPQRYVRLCHSIGATDRLRLIGPGSNWRINLLDYLCKMPGGGASAAVLFLSRLHDVVLRSEAGKQNEQSFWKNLFETGLMAAIELALIAEGRASLEMVSRILTTSPSTPEQAASESYYETHYCGQLLKKLDALTTDPACLPSLRRRCERVTDVLVGELASVGSKARGAVLSMNNGLIARLIEDPYYDLFCTDTTWTPEQAERCGFIDVIAYDVLTFGPPARMVNLAFAMLMQKHCLRRDPTSVFLPACLIRDEAGFVLHPEWDASVSVVSRSQKLLTIDVIQDFDVLLAALGGSPKSRHEAFAFTSNHMIKLIFGSTNTETNNYFSSFFGDKREYTTSGGSGRREEGGGLIDDLLGASCQFSWQQNNYEPYIRPGDFARLRTGEAVLYLAGRPIGPRREPFRIVDFWTGGAR